MLDRRKLCAHAYAGDGRFRYACTLELDHGGDNHEDRATEAPTVYGWIKPELIVNPRGLPMATMPPRVLVGG